MVVELAELRRKQDMHSPVYLCLAELRNKQSQLVGACLAVAVRVSAMPTNRTPSNARVMQACSNAGQCKCMHIYNLTSCNQQLQLWP